MKQIYLPLFLPLFLSGLLPAQNCAPDTVAPTFSTPLFYQGVNVMPTGMITVWAVDFTDSLQDNCSDPSKLTVQVMWEVMQTGCPPFSNSGGWQDYVTFDCSNLGIQEVYVRVIDEAGNIRVRSSPVFVSDPLSNCSTFVWSAGDACAAALNGDPLEDVYWDVFFTGGASPPGSMYSENSTCIRNFPLAAPWASDIVTAIRPSHHKNLLNGVTTFDLVLISKHILAYDAIDNPYFQLAADVNRSGSITTADIVAIRKAILGLESTFPNNGSWRLMPESYDFPDPAFAFAEPVPDSLQITYPVTETCFRFKGLKVGDVNGSAITSDVAPADDRQVLPLLVQEIELAAGNTGIIPVSIPKSLFAEGFQLAFRYDPAALLLEDVVSTLPDAQGGLQLFNDAENGVLRLNWFAPAAIALESGSELFAIHARALQPGAVRLQLADDILAAELYTPTEQVRLQPVYRKNRAANSLAPLQPNPWSAGDARAPVYLAEPSLVTLRMFDLNGRLLYDWQEQLPAGLQEVRVPEQVLSATSGMVLYQIIAGSTVLYDKLMMQL